MEESNEESDDESDKETYQGRDICRLLWGGGICLGKLSKSWVKE